jgi:hypothetical protein
MRDFNWQALCVIGLVIAVMIGLVGCDQSPVAKPDEMWTKIGHVDDGTGGASVYKKKDPETGKIVYVAIGVNSCSIQVVDGK